MFSLIQDFSDTPVVKQFDSIHDVFDPRCNTLNRHITNGRLTVDQFFRLLKSIYTKQNIRDNKQLFFLYARQIFSRSQLSMFYDAIEHLPNAYLPYLHFIRPIASHLFEVLAITQLSSPNDLMYDVYTASREQHNDYNTFLLNTIERVNSTVTPRLIAASAVTLHHPLEYNDCPVIPALFHYLIDHRIYTGDLRPSDISASTEPFQIRAELRDSLILLTAIPTITKNNKSPLYNVFNYNTNVLNYLPQCIKLPTEQDPLLMGVELELSTDYSCQQLIDATDEPFFLIKHDSSVTGAKRFKYELVTAPMSFKTHKQQWARWFNNLDYNQFDCTKNTNNGMHVHLGKQSFSGDSHLRKFTWFICQPAHYDFMLTVSERDRLSMRSYAPMPTFEGVTRAQAFARVTRHVSGIRGAVNFTNKATIEVRLFRGFVSYAEMIKNLEFVESIFHYTKDASLQTLTLRHYIDWLHSQPKNRYSVIRRYFQKLPALPKLIKTADIMSLIFTETNPDKIYRIVTAAKFPLDNDHVTTLNRLLKKRTFVLNKATNLLQLVTPNVSKLAFLDRELEVKQLGKHKTKQPPNPPITATSIQTDHHENDIFDLPDVDDDDDIITNDNNNVVGTYSPLAASLGDTTVTLSDILPRIR